MKALTTVVCLTAATLAVAPARAAPIDYTFTLAAENGSGVSGSGTMELNGNLLTVNLNATGLVPNQAHPSHIHGLIGTLAPNTTIAPPSADSNKDGFVEKTEGALLEGPPLFDLPPNGVRKSYGTASSNGTLSFSQTYLLTNTALYDPDNNGLALSVADILGTTGGNTTPLVDRLVELHGLNVPAGIDGTPPGTGLVYDQEMPVAAGRIQLATVVPEPASIALLGLAIPAMLTFRRRR